MGLNDFKLLLFSLTVLFSCNCAFTFTTPEKQDFFNESPHYHSEEQLLDLFAHLAKNNPTLARVHSIGRSVEGRDLAVIEISKNVGRRALLMPMFKYVANMHGDETIGREMLIYLAQYLLDNYNVLPEITKLVDETDIFLMPSMNPDGFNRSKVNYLSKKKNFFSTHIKFHRMALSIYWLQIAQLMFPTNVLFFVRLYTLHLLTYVFVLYAYLFDFHELNSVINHREIFIIGLYIFNILKKKTFRY